jgi:DNA polymerase-3 subunit alpha
LIKAGAFDTLELNRACLIASVDRAFDFAAAASANVHQVGLFDMGGEDDHGSSTQEPDVVPALPWGVKERLTQEKTALGFYLSGHLFDEVAQEVRRFAKRPIDELLETREPQLLAGIVNDLRTINGQRGKIALFKLDDKSGAIEARADEALINAHKHWFKEDALVIAMGRVQTDRFSGGTQFTITQLWDLDAARCRFGRYLRLSVKGDARSPDVAQLLRDFPPRREMSEQGELVRGLPVRISLECPAQGGTEGAAAEVQLDDQLRFYPSDEALARWRVHADQGRAAIAYE